MGDVIAVDHHRRQRHTGGFRHVNGIEFFHEGRLHARTEGFHHLHDEFLPRCIGSGSVIMFSRWRGVATTVRVVTHIWRTAEAGQTTTGHG